MKIHFLQLFAAFALDALVGDPHWLPHPIRWIGTLISVLEKALRRLFPATKWAERTAGLVEVLLVLLISGGVGYSVLFVARQLSIRMYYTISVVICTYMLAARSLRDESMKVVDALEKDGLFGARYALSMIVGRDTACLDEAGVIRAAVETVAENTSDGVIAPMLYMMLFGPMGGIIYKAINTMDSMLGYRNDRYRYFGTAAARLDDAANFIPARISCVLMCVAACFCGLNGKNAWKIFLRDRLCHKSPNSAHTEAACAGALGLQLAGSSYYFGELVEKPTIGDPLRNIERKDVAKANLLMYVTALLLLAVGSLVCFL